MVAIDEITYTKTVITLILFITTCVKGITKKEDGLIYILMGTDIKAPFVYIQLEKMSFTSKNCSYQNCFISNDASYFDDITDFDVLLYNAVGTRGDTYLLPYKRSPKQIFVFSSVESSSNYPLEDTTFNGFFNFTWTYKLNSDLFCPYLVVRNKKGELIGPKIDMEWMDVNDMKPISHYIKYKLRNKNKAGAWFVSHCNAPSERLAFFNNLNAALSKFGHRIDMIGECGNLKCPRGWMEECYALIETDYYFYLSFENSLSVDYVTEKLLTAVEHYAVPVVLGAANYSRFMPPGMYLDALAFGPEALAIEMNDVITYKNKYYDFFKWHRYYSFHDPSESADSDPMCTFCEFLNRRMEINETNVYPDIVRWFNEKRDWPKAPLGPDPPTVAPIKAFGEFISELFNYYVVGDS